MSTERSDPNETAEHERFRRSVQRAQERYEAALRAEMADSGESGAAQQELSEANRAYAEYLDGFPRKPVEAYL